MTRAGTSPALPRSIVDQFAADPTSVILAVLRDAAQALDATAIKRRLEQVGLDPLAVKKAWDNRQPSIRCHDSVRYESRTYQWRPAPPVNPLAVVDRLAAGRVTGAQRAASLAVVRAALEGAESVRAELAETRAELATAEKRMDALTRQAEQAAHAGPGVDRNAERRRAARERHARMDAMSRVAELAAEVEELLAKGADTPIVLQHVRALTDDCALVAIGRPGQRVRYDGSRHDPVGKVPPEGAPVVVVRPGYLWNVAGEAVLVSRAVVKSG